MNNNKQFRCEVKGTHGDVFLFGTIGGDWFGGVTAEEVAKEVNAMGNLKTMTVHVNSLGGDVFEGIAMRAAFMKSNAEVDAQIYGIAASAATVAIAIPDVSVTMAEGSRYMIHNPWGFAIGESDEMRKTADLLDSIRGDLISIYEARSEGLSRDEIGAMMDEETWLSVDESIGHGFATDTSSELAIAACVPDSMRDKLKHAPDDLLETPEDRKQNQVDLGIGASDCTEVIEPEEVIQIDSVRSRLQESRIRVAKALLGR